LKGGTILEFYCEFSTIIIYLFTYKGLNNIRRIVDFTLIKLTKAKEIYKAKRAILNVFNSLVNKYKKDFFKLNINKKVIIYNLYYNKVLKEYKIIRFTLKGYLTCFFYRIEGKDLTILGSKGEEKRKTTKPTMGWRELDVGSEAALLEIIVGMEVKDVEITHWDMSSIAALALAINVLRGFHVVMLIDVRTPKLFSDGELRYDVLESVLMRKPLDTLHLGETEPVTVNELQPPQKVLILPT
ncbi:hypothetical protein LZ32DRAFT_623240, partial [Colletotrichum eremochloae]